LPTPSQRSIEPFRLGAFDAINHINDSDDSSNFQFQWDRNSKAKTLFFSFEIDEVADDVKHVLQQHYPQGRRGAGMRSLFFDTN